MNPSIVRIVCALIGVALLAWVVLRKSRRPIRDLRMASGQKKCGGRSGIIFSPQAYAEMEQLSSQSGHSVLELVRLGLGYVKLMLETAKKGNLVLICRPDGNPIEQVVLPDKWVARLRG